MSIVVIFTLILINVALLLVGLSLRIARTAKETLRRRRELRDTPLPKRDIQRGRPIRLLAVLGSGGHTSEMLRLVESIATTETRVTYAVSSGDSLSATRAESVREGTFVLLPRARHVGERFIIAAPRAFLCAIASVRVLLRTKPEILLCNGPGTSAVIALICVTLNAMHLIDTRIIYAESICRVSSLSLSGRLLYPFANRFLVQWATLAQRYDAVEYRGRYS